MMHSTTTVFDLVDDTKAKQGGAGGAVGAEQVSDVSSIAASDSDTHFLFLAALVFIQKVFICAKSSHWKHSCFRFSLSKTSSIDIGSTLGKVGGVVKSKIVISSQPHKKKVHT